MNIFAFELRHLRMTLLFTLFLYLFVGNAFLYMFIKEDLDMMMVFLIVSRRQ